MYMCVCTNTYIAILLTSCKRCEPSRSAPRSNGNPGRRVGRYLLIVGEGLGTPEVSLQPPGSGAVVWGCLGFRV